MAATGNWIDTDGELLGGLAVPADKADSVLFDLGDLRMEVVDVSNCLFTEFVARFCFFTGTEDAGGDGDSGELSSDGKVGISLQVLYVSSPSGNMCFLGEMAVFYLQCHFRYQYRYPIRLSVLLEASFFVIPPHSPD